MSTIINTMPAVVGNFQVDYNGTTAGAGKAVTAFSANGRALSVTYGNAGLIDTVKVDGNALAISNRSVNITGKANASDLTAHTGNGDIHVTAANKTAWNAKYDKPSGGIPKTDLASAVQTSLGKADTALQSVKTINSTSLVGTGNINLQTPLTAGTDYVVPVSGKGLSTNDYTTAEKNKLGGIATGAEVNVQSDWNATSGDAFIKNKPTALSAFTNDSGFITKAVNDLTNYYTKSNTYTKTEVNNLISTHLTLSVVSALPTSNISTTTIYLVPGSDSATSNAYDEYVYTNNAWEKIGTTVTDLTPYAKTADVNTALAGKANNFTVATSGNGNAVTAVSYASNKITVTKGTTFLTQHQTIPGITVVDSEDGNAVTDVTASGHKITLARGKTFSEVGHTHAISDVTNLQTTLDGKAASGHTHDGRYWQVLGDLGSNYTMNKTDFNQAYPCRRKVNTFASNALSPDGNNKGDYYLYSLGHTDANGYSTILAVTPRLGGSGVTKTNLYIGHFWNGTWQGWSQLAHISDLPTALSQLSADSTHRLVTDTEKTTWNNKSDLAIGTTATTAAAGNHTHNYAGSSSAGGAATSANKINTNAGSATKPVYFSGGIPVQCTYELNKSVPADAHFTDTTYSSLSAAQNGTAVSLVTTGEKYVWNNKSNLAIGTTATTAAAGNHTHNISLTSGGTATVNLAHNTAYTLTAGGKSVVFKTPVLTAGANITITSNTISATVPAITSTTTSLTEVD